MFPDLTETSMLAFLKHCFKFSLDLPLLCLPASLSLEYTVLLRVSAEHTENCRETLPPEVLRSTGNI